MSNKIQISQLPAATTPLLGNEAVPLVQSGETRFALASDIGAVGTYGSRTIASKLGDIVSVKDFGAVGDGITDDTVAIQSAVNSGLAVRIPAGVYIISGAGIQCPDGLTLFGDGRKQTILKKKAGVTELEPILRERNVSGVFQPLNDLTVYDIGFEGNGDVTLPGAKGAGLLRAYTGANWRIIGCDFYNSRGYGCGFEGAQSATDASKRGPMTGHFFEDCRFYSNGKQAYLTGPDTDDGIDCKSSDRLTLVRCQAWDNGDKGFDIRCRALTMIGCYSWSNAGAGFASQVEGEQAGTLSITPSTSTFIGCWAYDNTASGFAVVPQATVGVVDGLQFVEFIGCHASNNTHNFNVTSHGTNELTRVRLLIDNCVSRSPTAGSRHFLASDVCEVVKINGGLFYGGTTSALSINSNDVGHFHITGATIEGTGGNAITGSTQNTARITVTGCTFRNITGFAITAQSNLVASGNNFEGVSQAAIYSLTGTNNRVLDQSVGVRTVASATAITLPEITDTFVISGTTSITSITASWAGRRCHLRFSGVLTLTDGSNLILNTNYVTANNASILLECDGTNWRELCRSTN